MNQDSIWTRTFAFLCSAQFLGYAHNSILTPTIPLYVTHLGGSAFVVGLVLAAFTVTSVILRPLIGYWADAWSEAGVLVSGLILLGASILLFFVPLVEATMVANGLRGIGWAGLNTGGYTLLARAAPLARRGEASGYYSGVQGSATIFFPAVALWLIGAPWGGFRVVILVSTALAVAGASMGLILARQASRNTPPEPSSYGPGTRPFWAVTLVDREVVLASALLFCLNLPHPAVSGFLVLYAQEIGIGNIGWYFVVSGSATLLARPLLGRISDKVGRAPSLVTGFALEILALLLLVLAADLVLVLISGVFYALGSAIGTTATMALAMERADPLRRGRAMATFSVAFPMSVGVGALVSGGAVELAGYVWMFLIIAVSGVAGLLLTATNWTGLK